MLQSLCQGLGSALNELAGNRGRRMCKNSDARSLSAFTCHTKCGPPPPIGSTCSGCEDSQETRQTGNQHAHLGKVTIKVQ